MNRTDRLYALAEELRRAGRAGTTGARLARTFEVSVRTIKRDVSALQAAGVPVWAQAGPGGGYVLDAAASLPPVNFTPAQAVAVAVALAALPPGSPFAVDGAAARGKLVDALAPADRDRAAELAGRVWLDHGGVGPAPADPRVLRAVEQSLARHRALSIRFRGGGGQVTERTVEPVLLAHARGAWHLVAWCRLREGIRWFRLDRVERADVTADPVRLRDVREVGEPPPRAAPVG